MEKLKESLDEVMVDLLEIDGDRDGLTWIDYNSKQKCVGFISNEIRDIAIAYRFWHNKLPNSRKEKPEESNPGTWTFIAVPEEELFNQFIEERYKEKS